ncbi:MULTISPECIES: type II secretion system secretin GspD [Pseudoalteromonas]|jgi:general secretion pathway protein D|uniref:Type II secretion system protein GspD n=1 Tax=Pseudoalteromonas agarivorans TaxID=176102 RepID=A0AAD0U1R9_9GAMM|nr:MULTISPECIES: type II secretion system secretin GspD [Pseudoalteromonas]MAJ41030.1 type II secretion system protein GspD [Pseudoalteromonadaceae bacterium]OUX84737.1 MAG: type II secretion system protein GspD [Pseudoalteromonas sp. TMED43]AYM87916.1 type II secretion system protein GspD [Pseudoalteromonas agarivorans]AZN34008.1 type II secretion system protein GspD [Pseudoalteromonas sp. Xi13]ETJ48401.1 general secretion pathway protein D [Pseudoalteromonas agarivorans]|tara:strand:- start:2641 stop:4710 length:2070 start_codon:yes stop_codon:yes gene_type:complete
MVQVLHLKKIKKGLAKYAALFLAASISLSVSAVEYAANFKGTDINEFINIVGKNLNKTVIIDPNVRGKVNVRSYELMDEALYYQFFLNVLEVYGYSAVEMDNGIIKIEKSSDAKKSNVPLITENSAASGDMMITRVVRVKNVSVQELGPLVRQFSDQKDGGHVANFNAANVMMLTGHAASVNRLVEIIRSVDQAGDKRVDIVKLKYATADDVVSVVENIYKDSGKGSVPEFLIPKVVADGRTNSVIVSGEGQARTRAIELIKRLDGELESQGNTKVFYLNYAKAEDLVKVLQGVSKTLAEDGQGTSKTRTNNKNDASIEAHPDSNSLVITAQPDTMRSLETVIDRLDIRRAQVLVEAIIVEVMESDGVNLGTQWISEDGGMLQFNNGSTVPVGSLAVAGIQAQDTTTTQTIIGTESGNVTSYDETTEGDYSALASLLSGVNGLAFGLVKNDWGAIIQAVSTDTNSNILATPSITTMDNEEASMIVGQEVPIITGSQTGSNNDNPFQTIERQEVGVKLKVTPQINDGSAVQLLIEQEVSSVSGATAVDISVNKRAITTTVMADDGGMVVLGGLIDEDVQESVSKVPILGDIPILGHLFKSTNTTKRKRNLIVFIRPTIIRDGVNMNKLSFNKYNFIRGEQMKEKEDGIELMPNSDVPLLPSWDDELILPPTYEEHLKALSSKERAEREDD